MGRGKGEEEATAAVRRGPAEEQRQATIDKLGFGALMRSGGGQRAASQKIVRDLENRTFIENVEEFREQEDEFLEGVRETLDEAVNDFIQTGKWGDFLRIPSRTTSGHGGRCAAVSRIFSTRVSLQKKMSSVS